MKTGEKILVGVGITAVVAIVIYYIVQYYKKKNEGTTTEVDNSDVRATELSGSQVSGLSALLDKFGTS